MSDTAKTTIGTKLFLLLCFLVVCLFICPAQAAPIAPALDKTRYITLDEIHPGQKAYCLSVLQGNNIEKFDLEVLSVVRNVQPGRDSILVVGTDPRFKKFGPIRGCSGSPVYIEGRMAGALSGGWSYSKDALYLTTPIEDMLYVAPSADAGYIDTVHGPASVGIDFSKPLDLAEIDKSLATANADSKLKTKNLELMVTSLPAEVCDLVAPRFGALGLLPVSGGSANMEPETGDYEQTLAPGACLTIPLVSGDISMTVVGTVTENIDDRVYGFGHSFLGYGDLDLPMATGRVHAVISSMLFSFKLAAAGPIIGAVRADAATAVYGEIGAKAKLIPMRMTIDHYNASPERTRTYDCRVAVNRIYTPIVTQTALIGAISAVGTLPPEHMLSYKGRIGVEGFSPISFENVSSGQSIRELANEAISPIAMLMNNPYQRTNITSLDFEVEVLPKNILSNIWSVRLSDTKVKPGQTIDVSVVLMSYLSEKKTHNLQLTIPENVPPGQYDISVAGSSEYEKYLRKVSPHKFTTYDLPSLVDALKDLLAIRRDRLYITMTLPAGGIVIQRAELSDLPQTKALLLGDAKRTTMSLPMHHWLQKDIYTGNIIVGKKTLKIKVEK
ncbi:MAG: hypothetical protein ACYTFK_02360 [Planctomycetota bacterium]|jgi:hypothetical protein